MSIFRITFFWLLFIAIPTQACHDLYHAPKTTLSSSEGRGLPVIEYSFDKEFAQQYVNYFDFEKRQDYTYKDLSDAAVYLTRLGQVDEALNLLQWLHVQHPHEYKIINNLGATYELAGKIDSAAHYIHKAIAVEPQAHQGSKWVHLKILEAKRKMQADPDWILNNNVLNLNWDTTFYADYPDSLYIAAQRDSIRQLRYSVYEHQFDTLFHVGLQMGKYIPYAQQPNLLVANIMKELGDYFAINLSVKDAFVAYKIGIYYDPNNQLKIGKQLDDLMPYFKKYEFDEHIFDEKFRPFQALELEEKKKILAHHRSNIAEAQKASTALYWQAGIALLLIVGMLLRIVLGSKNK